MVSINFHGNLGQDAELREVNTENKVASFSVATTRLIKGEKKTEWYSCQKWNPKGLFDYLKKGQHVVINGELQQREYESKIYYDVNCFSVELAGGKAEQQPSAQQSQPAPTVGGDPAGNDDLPF